MSLAGVLSAVFKLDVSEAEKAAKKIQRALGTELQDSLKGMGSSAGVAGDILAKFGPIGMAASAGVGAVSAAVAVSVVQLVAMGDRLTNLSRVTRISTDALQKMEAFGRPLGMSLEQMAAASNKLQKSLGDGGSGVTKALNLLHLTEADLPGVDAAADLFKVQKAISDLKSPLDQAAAGSAFFNKSWSEMRLDSASISEGKASVEGMIVVSKEALDAGDALGDSWGRLKANATALSAEAGKPVADMLTMWARLLNETALGWKLLIDAMNKVPKMDPNSDAAKFGTDTSALGVRSLAEVARGGISDAEYERQQAAQAAAQAKSAQDAANEILATRAKGIADEKAAEAAKKAAAAIEKHNEAMEKTWAELNRKGIPTLKDLGKEFNQLFGQVIEPKIDWMARVEANMGVAHAQAALQPYLTQASYTQAGNLGRNELAQNQAQAAIPKIVPLELKDDFENFSLSLADAADLLVVFGDGLGEFGTSIIKGAAIGTQLGEFFEDLGLESENLQLAFAGAGAFIAAWGATETGSQGKRTAKGAVAGASAGFEAAGPWGAAIGAVVGAIVGWARGRGPADVGRDAGRDMGVSLSQALMEEIDKSGEPIQTFLTEIFAEGNMGIDRFAEEVGDLFSMFGRSEISEGTLMAELMQDLPLLIEHFDELGDVGKENLARIIDAAEVAGIDLGIMGDQLERMAAGIPEATLEGMAESLKISVEQATALAALMGVPMQTDLQRMADDLDIPVEKLQELGVKLKEQFGVNIEDLDTLLKAMGITVEELAAKLGVELPAAAAAADEAIPDAGAPLDPTVFGATAGDQIAIRLAGGFKGMSDGIMNMDRSMSSLPDAIARAVRDAVAQAVG